MKKYGLIGFPLGHSFSKAYFTKKFGKEGWKDCIYDNFPLEDISMFPDLIVNEPSLIGLNVTIPYKEKVIPYLDKLEGEALEIGAVNTIKIIRDAGKKPVVKGFNTDCYGFEQPLLEVLKPHHTSAIILGTGGASKAVAYVLGKNNIRYTYVSRKPENESVLSYRDLTANLIRNTSIIVNCSPIGMQPYEEKAPDLPYDAITPDHIVYDLIYNPEKTIFLQSGEQKNATVINGLPMLHLQAEKSWEIWNANLRKEDQ